jgi:acyl-coenzyme A thioesterase PaaI-like protein
VRLQPRETTDAFHGGETDAFGVVRASSGLLTATGTVIKAGSRVGFTEGVVTDDKGAIVATASSTLLVFDL